MSDILAKTREQILKRIEEYNKQGELHMEEEMELGMKINKVKEKQRRLSKLKDEAVMELNEIDSYLEWRNKK